MLWALETSLIVSYSSFVMKSTDIGCSLAIAGHINVASPTVSISVQRSYSRRKIIARDQYRSISETNYEIHNELCITMIIFILLTRKLLSKSLLPYGGVYKKFHPRILRPQLIFLLEPA